MIGSESGRAFVSQDRLCKIPLPKGIIHPPKKSDQSIVFLKTSHPWLRQLIIIDRRACSEVPVFKSIGCEPVIVGRKFFQSGILITVSRNSTKSVIARKFIIIIYRSLKCLRPVQPIVFGSITHSLVLAGGSLIPVIHRTV